jgi:flagellar motor protein MotB
MKVTTLMILLVGATIGGCANPASHGHNEAPLPNMPPAPPAASRVSSPEAQQLLALQQERQQLLSTLGDFHERVRELESKLADREGKPIAKSYDELLAIKEAELSDLRKAAAESGTVVAQRDAVAAELAQARQRLTALEQQAAKKDQELASLRGLAAAAADMETAKRRAAELESQLMQRETEARTLRSAAAERESLAAQLHSAAVALNQSKERIAGLEKQLAQKEIDLHAQANEKQKLWAESTHYTAELKSARQRVAALEQQAAEREQQLQTVKRIGNDRERLASQLSTINMELAQTKQQASQLERQLAAKGREMETLRVLVTEQEKLIHQPAPRKQASGQPTAIKQEVAAVAGEAGTPGLPVIPNTDRTTGTVPQARKPAPFRGSDQLAKLTQTKNELVRTFQDDRTRGSVTIQQAGNQLSVSLPSSLLFSPGEVALKPDGIVILKRIGQVLAQDSERAIQVAGHTDNQAISKELKKTFPDNRAWSWARADSARKALITGGTPPDRIRAVGFADKKPLASNQTEAGRQKNRRIEIIVTQFSIPSRTVSPGPSRNAPRMAALPTPDRPGVE